MTAPATPDRIRISRPDGTGFQLAGHHGEPGPGTSSAPAVLVLPAMGVGARYYRPLTEALAQAGVDALAVELRGHEEDGLPVGRGRDHGYLDVVADVEQALAVLVERRGGAPVHLLGHSFGGQVGAVVAARDAATGAGRVAGLALVASGTPYWRAWSPAMLLLSQSAGLLARVLGHFPGHRFRFAGRESRTQMTDWARLARTGRFLFGAPRTDHGATMADARLPLLALSLAGDELAPPRSVDDLADRFAAADVERVHLDPAALGFPEADHLRWARLPGVVLPTLTDWLARTAAPTTPATPRPPHAG